MQLLLKVVSGERSTARIGAGTLWLVLSSLRGGDMITADIDEVIDLMNQKVIETQINDLKKYTIKGYIPDNIASVTMTVLQAQLKHNKKGDSNDKS